MKELICITCPRGCRLQVDDNFNVTGNFCPRGVIYAKNELTHPVRTLTSTVKLISEFDMRLPVKTKEPIAKEKIIDAMEEINRKTVNAPVHIGDIIISNIAGTGVDLVATKNIIK